MLWVRDTKQNRGRKGPTDPRLERLLAPSAAAMSEEGAVTGRTENNLFLYTIISIKNILIYCFTINIKYKNLKITSFKNIFSIYYKINIWL